MAHEETQTSQSVRNYAVVPSAAFNLSGRGCFLEFMTKAPEFAWPSHFVGGRLLTAEYCGLSGHFHLFLVLL